MQAYKIPTAPMIDGDYLPTGDGGSEQSRFMSTRPNTTLADFRGRGIPKSLFL
jgi:hypothetical protein